MIAEAVQDDLDTTRIKDWRSIVTLIVFIVTNIIVLFPFHIPFYIPRKLYDAIWDGLSKCRIIPPRRGCSPQLPSGRGAQAHGRRGSQFGSRRGSYVSGPSLPQDDQNGRITPWKGLHFPMNFVTAPLIADLFLLAILAIGKKEVHDGTLGADNIHPIDIMAFFLTLAYIAISIDASGLIRYLAFKVLQKGGKHGRKLYFYLYAFFFGLASFIGNDPIILSGTPFLAYMTRVSNNVKHPRAWIHTQFAVANIGSAILVSSNPTNLVLAGAFDIKFIIYTANMIVPVIVTAIVLFPVLLHMVFPYEALIPSKIELHELSDGAKDRKPVNPNIPFGRGTVEEEESEDDAEGKHLSLEEIMNPFVDKWGAGLGAVIMATTLITILTVNASSQKGKDKPVYWVTLPAAFVMFCWVRIMYIEPLRDTLRHDVASGWCHRDETRKIARDGRKAVEAARAEREKAEEEVRLAAEAREMMAVLPQGKVATEASSLPQNQSIANGHQNDMPGPLDLPSDRTLTRPPTVFVSERGNNSGNPTLVHGTAIETSSSPKYLPGTPFSRNLDDRGTTPEQTAVRFRKEHPPTTLVSFVANSYQWCQETFPTTTAVLSHLPYALVPFAFCMFVLVQALVTKGWVPVFAYGWGHWVNKTGTVGAIGGMAFVSVIMCNFAGTNIGTTILLCRVIQAWHEIHQVNDDPITQRTFWATVYSMALGVNYGAFSTAFSASLAGLLWRDILQRKFIYVSRLDFARVNLPIIAVAMAIGCAILIGEVYITRGKNPYEG